MTYPLSLFNEKAEKLVNSSFVRFMREVKRFSFEVSVKRGEHVKTKRILPTQEEIEAFVLTFRFFIQNNERCSFGNLDGVYRDLPISQSVKDEFLEAREKLNQYLDSKISINIYGDTPTRRKLLDVFVYGGLAHATPEKKEIYDLWSKHGIVYGIIEVEFCSTLEMVLHIIQYVTNVNSKALNAAPMAPAKSPITSANAKSFHVYLFCSLPDFQLSLFNFANLGCHVEVKA